MSKRTEELAVRLEQGYAQLASYAEGLSTQEWAALIPQEGRSVGVLVHHVATMYPVETGVAQIIANGQAVAGLTWDLVADMNANHALEHAQPDRAATLAMLRSNGAEAAAAIRALTDAQLDTAVSNSLYGGAPLSLQFWLEETTRSATATSTWPPSGRWPPSSSRRDSHHANSKMAVREVRT